MAFHSMFFFPSWKASQPSFQLCILRWHADLVDLQTSFIQGVEAVANILSGGAFRMMTNLPDFVNSGQGWVEKTVKEISFRL